MQVLIDNPQAQTWLFTALFVVVLLATARRGAQGWHPFTPELTNELKGFAILTIIFGHIGYFLAADHSFLYPLSVLSGVGVNLFLFLSGFGLTMSTLRERLHPLSFYRKRLPRIFLPMWIVLTVLYLADYFVLGRGFAPNDILANYLGIFHRADVGLDVDSPLWYFSFILGYYLLYPWIFWRRVTFISPLAIFVASLLILDLPLPIDKDVLNLYKLHTLAFPLGVAFALVLGGKIHTALQTLPNPLSGFFRNTRNLWKFLLTFMALCIFAYTAVWSEVGADRTSEQTISLITMFSAIVIFWLKTWEFRLFQWFGLYSYEIYLIHWPLLYHYDVIYKNVPAGIATALYLLVFLILGMTLQKITSRLRL